MHWILRLVGVFLIAASAVKSSLGNDELPTVTIGYLDLIQDVRYEDWGVHPVDIRSATAIVDRRAYAGARPAAPGRGRRAHSLRGDAAAVPGPQRHGSGGKRCFRKKGQPFGIGNVRVME